MQLLGAIFIISAGSIMGFCKAHELKQRINGIIMLQNAFRLLETEIFYTRTPVPQAIRILEVKISEPMRSFFFQVRCAVEQEHLPLYQAWEKSLQRMEQNSYWCEEEMNAVRSFGLSLGDGDVQEQEKNFQLLQQRLQQALCQAERRCSEKTRIWQYMGVCISTAVVLLLC